MNMTVDGTPQMLRAWNGRFIPRRGLSQFVFYDHVSTHSLPARNQTKSYGHAGQQASAWPRRNLSFRRSMRQTAPDRTSVVYGKSVSVRVDRRGRRIIKKKN